MDEVTKNPSWRESGVAGALAFLGLSASTEWLSALPPVPDGQMTEYVLALAAIIAGIGRAVRWAYRKRQEAK